MSFGGGPPAPAPVPQISNQSITPPPQNAALRSQQARQSAAGAAVSALAGGLNQNGSLTRKRPGFTTAASQALG